MNHALSTSFSERQKTSAQARQALLSKMRPRPTITDPQPIDRSEQRAQHLRALRAERAAARAEKRLNAAAAEAEILRLQAEAEAAALDAQRSVRKERKALSAAEAKARRDAKYAARKARQ